ncbi:MAG: hypothetical protein UY46_C0005G0006 [Candidatus Kaiserbacteria bacterium GW2011_GWA2_49_56]|uniref:Uncharacterized protein n=1 Tax=Candidatus Kaiserbacteria bacterium GW2011_GWA2_49_56 TaxID=1618670 RepID=A0A0G1VRE8_9BACT|nr:MAG: hypothetical protein UY46_C0005G0006 [Candidatus Kaiserbacteria bacterium GW2011_GWA2_49_56]
MTFESGFDQSDKAALDLIGQLEDQLDSDVSIRKHIDTEYVLSSRGLTRLILDIHTHEKIIKIMWRNRGFSPNSPHSADYVFRDNNDL